MNNKAKLVSGIGLLVALIAVTGLAFAKDGKVFGAVRVYSTAANVNLSSVTGDIIPSANNTYNIGASTSSWKDIYASGTIYNSGGITTTGNVTSTGVVYTGQMNLADDGGFPTAIDMQVTSAATANTQESYAFNLDGSAFLKVFGLSDGLGGLQSTTTALLSFVDFAPDPSRSNLINFGTTNSAWGNLYASGTAKFGSARVEDYGKTTSSIFVGSLTQNGQVCIGDTLTSTFTCVYARNGALVSYASSTY